EGAGDDSVCGRALDIPEAHLIGQMLLGHAKALTPFLYISHPIGWCIWVQPAVGRNTVNDDRGVPNTLKSKLLSCVLKAPMCASIKLWISSGGRLLVVGGACARDAGTVDASVVMAIAVRRVGFDMDDLFPVLPPAGVMQRTGRYHAWTYCAAG